nr:4Fe-4S cluster-binding domain-containing protein [Streptomyces chartreusis]
MARLGNYMLRDGKVFNPESLEVNAVQHCNLSCRTCSHLSPALAKSEIAPAALFDDLSALACSYTAKNVKILGGEPLLHSNLVGLIEAVRASGVTETVTVCTNGKALPKTTESFWRAVDAVLVSEYPGHELTLEQYEHINDMSATHAVDTRVYRYERFRESYSEIGADDPALVARIFETCKMAHDWQCHTVENGYFYLCPQASFIPKLIPSPLQSNGIRISADEGFAQQLRDYLERDTPLAACGNCLGSAGKLMSHQQMRRSIWRNAQQKPTEELIDWSFLETLTADIHVPDGCTLPVRDSEPLAARVALLRATT